jgi:thymidylate kinase
MKIKAWYLKRKKGLDPKKDAILVDIYRKRGILFMLIYYADLWLRYREIKKISKKKIVLTDRFFYDGLVLTKERYLPFFRKITPKVKSFFLYASPEVILKRKMEATAENMIDYKKRVEEKLLHHFDISMIDTSKSIKEVVKGIIKEIKNE